MSAEDTLDTISKSELDLPPEVKQMWEEYLDSLFKHCDNPTESNKRKTGSTFQRLMVALCGTKENR